MMILGVRLPWVCRSRGYAYLVLMAKQPKSSSSSRMSPLPAAAISTLVMICASALLGLAFLSMLVHDLDRHTGPFIQLKRGTVHPMLARSQDLQDVPSEGDISSDSIWESPSARFFYGCSEPREEFSFSGVGFPSKANGYLMIEASGGLNQQRTGITDAVVAARLLNATLVVPGLDHKSYWKDNSNFSDIFDVDWFIKSLTSDVSVVKELPAAARSKYLKRNHLTSMRVPRKCTPQYYQSKILPILQKKKVLRLTKFDYRLANKLEPELQRLRCRVNYRALQFTPEILNMGNSLVSRMRQMSKRYIALHLRYESDMLAFSGCYYGGGDKEIKELGAIRKRWKTLHVRSPERERRNGKCPLTPKEVGLMLRALGFGNDSYLYVASGEVYGGEESLAPLKALFPNYFTKETLTTKEELQPFLHYSSRMAALDYIVSDESNVFVTNNNGNMARILAGRRRYYGHKRTIRPNTKKLGSLFLARHEMPWDAFAAKVKTFQKGFMGEPNEMKQGRGEFHENPAACICEKGVGAHSPVDPSGSYNDTSYNYFDEDQLGSYETEVLHAEGEAAAEELPLFSD
ncbi:protein ROOT HAIR SPECIFIC 17 [Selaginella moellendorffii]|nr:protein ROOT HAIR SPECIFIC 17 [Selaginella moellendorffii]|eukprot:XP_002986571.2 protein ROOT HAIR SPECIFIC 17 [Selaginella moellendorffii]